MKTIQLSISDMHCASCVKGITEAVQAVPGVQQVAVNFATRSAEVEGEANPAQLIAAIKQAGYTATELADTEQSTDEAQQLYRHRLKQAVVAAIVGIPLFSDVFVHWIPTVDTTQRQWFWFVIAAVVLAVMYYSGGHIYRGLWQSVKSLRGNMDTLVGMGTGVAWLYSTIVICIPNYIPSMARHVYFDTTTLLLAFITFGSALESRARGKTSDAIRQLIELAPKTARVIRNGKDVDLPIAEINVDDELRLLPGEKVAVDGIVIDGDSQINESMLTGEPLPVHKQQGSKVFAGTINESGSVVYKASGIGANTALSRIIMLVQKAQNTKPQVSRLVDTIASVFVPCVLLAMILTVMGWSVWGPQPVSGFVLKTAIAVLVIACPCALGLATPMAIMCGVGKAAQFGILIRDGNAIQTAAALDVVLLDKTGTITKGQPEVTDVLANDLEQVELLQLAASLEKNSEHPLARAIVEANELMLLPADSFQALSGMGVRALIQNQILFLGNHKLMRQQTLSVAAYEEDYERLSSEGKTVIFVANNDEVLGLIAIADAIKDDSLHAISKLKQQGLHVVMLTGDTKPTADYIAKQVGIDEVVAQVMPEDKVNQVKQFQQQGRKVAMVGDGINDAAALSQADVGIAMGSGADVAIEAADMALMTGSLVTVVDAIFVSHKTLRNVKENLFGAFFYNTLGIPIAAGVFYPWLHMLLSPLIAGAAMALSSVTVVLNANRLRLLKRSTQE